MQNTPLNGRDWAQLATLQAGVTGVQTGSATGGGNTDRGFGAPISISGARPDQTAISWTDSAINDYSNGARAACLGQFRIDAVEQVSVLGRQLSCGYGRTSGGVINAITRSGTKQFHGDIYEFFRNSALDARNFLTEESSFQTQSVWRLSWCPLQTDRMFIFGDYEGLRQSLGVTTVETVPSLQPRDSIQAERGPGPATLCSIPQTSHSFHRTVAQQLRFPVRSGFSRQSGSHNAYRSICFALRPCILPAAERPLLGNGDTGIFSFAGQQITNENYFTVRVDRKISDKDALTATYMRDNSKNCLARRLSTSCFQYHFRGAKVVTLQRATRLQWPS